MVFCEVAYPSPRHIGSGHPCSLARGIACVQEYFRILIHGDTSHRASMVEWVLVSVARRAAMYVARHVARYVGQSEVQLQLVAWAVARSVDR